MNIAYWLLFFVANVLAYVIGRYDGKRSFGKTVYISEWPRFSMQWDGYLSQAEVIKLLDKVRAHVLANPLAKPPKHEKPPCRSIVPTSAKEPGNE